MMNVTDFRIFFSPILFSIFILFSGEVLAQEQIWNRAKQLLDRSKPLVADQVKTNMEMIDNDGVSLGTMTIQEKISGWEKGEPSRIVTFNSNPEYAEIIKTRFKIGIDNHPDQGLIDNSRIESSESAVLNGKECILFVASGERRNYKFKSQVWIEKSSERPLKVIHTYSGISFVKAMTQTIMFGSNNDGNWVPVSSVLDSTVSLLFKKMRIITKYQFDTWISRPNAQLP